MRRTSLRWHHAPEWKRLTCLDFKTYLQNQIFQEWAMLGSNQRPLPCEVRSPFPISSCCVLWSRLTKQFSPHQENSLSGCVPLSRHPSWSFPRALGRGWRRKQIQPPTVFGTVPERSVGDLPNVDRRLLFYSASITSCSVIQSRASPTA